MNNVWFIFKSQKRITSFKFNNFHQILKLIYVSNVAEDVLSVNFTKFVPSQALI